ncbi:MAG: prepilin-type N-terminal cleavage/methylation domain-containing protein [Gemmatimonadetes bacterium]|nr:prepilin-type N-terminal cleavage/methylation domain-containing protein [Gemmatimonadota bacterium]
MRNNKGFTLIELMIVVVIIGILAAIAIPKFNSVSKNAKQAEAGPVLKQICTLQGTYFQENGSYAPNGTEIGWDNPNAKYFDFSWTGTATASVATATPARTGITSGLVTATRDCVTGAVTP